MRLILPTLLLLAAGACTSADTDYQPSCDDGSCDEQARLELVEFCRVDGGVTWDCEEIDASVDLCDYDGNYRIGGGIVQLHEKDGAICNLNALTTCHALHVAQSGDHFVCELGSRDILVGFDGIPLEEGGREICADLDHWEGYKGYVHDKAFSVGKEGASCQVTGDAFAIPDGSIQCHGVVISQAGMACQVGANDPVIYPFSD
jgi:hypothetical protein